MRVRKISVERKRDNSRTSAICPLDIVSLISLSLSGTWWRLSSRTVVVHFTSISMHDILFVYLRTMSMYVFFFFFFIVIIIFLFIVPCSWWCCLGIFLWLNCTRENDRGQSLCGPKSMWLLPVAVWKLNLFLLFCSEDTRNLGRFTHYGRRNKMLCVMHKGSGDSISVAF